jgi:hypothetical protein
MHESGTGPLRLELEAPAEVAQGEPVTFRLRLRNTGAEPTVVYLRGREIAFDIVVARTDGDTVWRRLTREPIQAIVQVRRLNPGGELVLEDHWNERDRAGRVVPPGEYMVRGVLFTDQPQPLETAPRPLRIRAPG